MIWGFEKRRLLDTDENFRPVEGTNYFTASGRFTSSLVPPVVSKLWYELTSDKRSNCGIRC